MSDTIPDQALIVVADGAKAILFRNTGHGGALSLREEQRLTPQDVAEQGPSGARPVEQTVKQTGEATFVNGLAHVLQSMHGRSAFSALVLVAPAKTLGELRSALHHVVAATVVHSVSKDLTNHPTADIEKALA